MNDSDYFKSVIGKLNAKLKPISDRISGIVAKLDSGKTINYAALRSQLNIAYSDARKVILQWTNLEIPAIYRDSLKEVIAGLKALPIKVPNANYSDLKTMDKNLNDILNNVLTSFDKGLQNGEQTLLRLVNATQQVAVDEKAINRAIAEGYAQGGSTQSAKKALQQELMAKAKDGKYIEVVDKNGDSRQFEIKSYSEMVARTKLADASAQAVLNTANQVSADLVQISDHNTQTPICQEYEGKVFSLSGNDSDFPVLDMTPPFHPNCLHSMSIIYKEAMQIDGTYDSMVEKSNAE